MSYCHILTFKSCSTSPEVECIIVLWKFACCLNWCMRYISGEMEREIQCYIYTESLSWQNLLITIKYIVYTIKVLNLIRNKSIRYSLEKMNFWKNNVTLVLKMSFYLSKMETYYMILNITIKRNMQINTFLLF